MAIVVQPVKEGKFVFLLSAILAIMTSPATTPIGLAIAIVDVELSLLTLVVAALPPRWKMLVVLLTRIAGLEAICTVAPEPLREAVVKV